MYELLEAKHCSISFSLFAGRKKFIVAIYLQNATLKLNLRMYLSSARILAVQYNYLWQITIWQNTRNFVLTGNSYFVRDIPTSNYESTISSDEIWYNCINSCQTNGISVMQFDAIPSIHVNLRDFFFLTKLSIPWTRSRVQKSLIFSGKLPFDRPKSK